MEPPLDPRAYEALFVRELKHRHSNLNRSCNVIQWCTGARFIASLAPESIFGLLARQVYESGTQQLGKM